MYSNPSTQETSINACQDAGLRSLFNRGDYHCACGRGSGSAGVQAEEGFQSTCGERWLVCMLDAACHMCAAQCGYACIASSQNLDTCQATMTNCIQAVLSSCV